MTSDREYLAAGLALGGLSPAEEAEAQELAATDAEFRAEVASYEDTLALMAETDDPQPVSEATREAVLSIPGREAQQTPEPRGAPVPQVNPETHLDPDAREDQEATAPPTPITAARGAGGKRPRRWLVWTAAAAAVIVIAGLGATVWQQDQRQDALEDTVAQTQRQLAETTRLLQAEDLQTRSAELPAGGRVTVASSETEQLIRVSSHDVDVSPSGQSLQMWVIGAEGPVSAGLMTGEPVTITGRGFSAGSLFGITVEPAGGSPQPTTDPLIALGL